MPTYRDLFEKLATLSPEQLDSEIKVIPVGYTDGEAAELMRYDILPQVIELAKASRDLYHFAPSEDGEWCEPGVCWKCSHPRRFLCGNYGNGQGTQ